MGGKGDFDISGSGGADPRDEYAPMNEVLPSDFPYFEDGAGEVEEIPGGLPTDTGLYYFQSSYTFNSFPGTDGFFGFSNDVTYAERKNSLGAVLAAGDYFIDFISNRVYSYMDNFSTSYVHLCEAQIEFESDGPIAIPEERVELIGFLNTDITDETFGGGRTLPNYIATHNYGDGIVLAWFHSWSSTGFPDHSGFYRSEDGGQTFTQLSVANEGWLGFIGTAPAQVGATGDMSQPGGRYTGFMRMPIGEDVYVATGSRQVWSTSSQGALWENWNMRDLVNDRNSPADSHGYIGGISRDPQVISGDIIKAASAAPRWFAFVSGSNPYGSGGGTIYPCDLVHVYSSGVHLNPTPPPTWLSPEVYRLHTAVGNSLAEHMITTYDEASDIVYIQGFHGGTVDGYSVTQLVPAVIMNNYRWRDRFPTETMGVDWTMQTGFSPDMINCYAIMGRAHQLGSGTEYWWWKSNDFGVTWQRVAMMHWPGYNDYTFNWFLFLTSNYQKILAGAYHGGAQRYKIVLSEDGGATWTEIESIPILDNHYSLRYKTGTTDFPCGMRPEFRSPPQWIDEFHYYHGDHAPTNDTAVGIVSCLDTDYYGRGGYMKYTVAGTTLTERVVCSSDAGFIIRAEHINGLRTKLAQLNATVQTGGTNRVNFGIDVSDLPTVSQNKTAVRAEHYEICKRETDKVIGQVGTDPGGPYYSDTDLIQYALLMPDPVVDDPVSIRTLIGMRKTLQALYADGYFCACYSYCPCQTHFEFEGGGSKK